MWAYLSISRHKQGAWLLFMDAGMEEHAGV